jgi:hypothetical protein
MMAHDYAIWKEARGYSVWSLKPYTGDKADCLSLHDSKRNAIAALKRYRAGALLQRPKEE